MSPTNQPGESFMHRWFADDVRVYFSPGEEYRKGFVIISPSPGGAGVFLIAGGGTSDYEALAAQLALEIRRYEVASSELQGRLLNTAELLDQRTRESRVFEKRCAALEGELTDAKRNGELLAVERDRLRDRWMAAVKAAEANRAKAAKARKRTKRAS